MSDPENNNGIIMALKRCKKRDAGSASRRAFVNRYGPMKIHNGYGYDIEEYDSTQRDWWTVWEAARKWQRENPKEK